MPNINLIYEQRVAIRKAASQRRTMIGVTLASAVIALGAFGSLFVATESALGEERALQAEVDKMEPMIKMIESTTDQFNTLNPRLTTLEDAAKVTQRWTRVLDHMSRSCPENVWMTSLRCNQSSEEEPVRIEVQGLGPSQESISDLILRLQSSLDLENVNLKYTQAEIKDEKQFIKFEVSADVQGTAKPKPVEKEEKKEGEGA